MPPLASLQPPRQASRALAERKQRLKPNDIARIGLAIAKSVFRVHGAAADGRAVLRRRLRERRGAYMIVEARPFFPKNLAKRAR